jgi:hypothetical protein
MFSNFPNVSLLQISEINSELMLPSTTPTTFGGGEYTPSTLPNPHFYNNGGGGHSTPEPYYYGGSGGGGRGMQLEERPKSHMLLETDLDQMQPPRSKSENLLETNFDYDPYEHHRQQDFLSRANRSKSQPLEEDKCNSSLGFIASFSPWRNFDPLFDVCGQFFLHVLIHAKKPFNENVIA